jgi:2'-hydroxyisoflavone reductase
MRVLVVGGTRFIGRHLVEFLMADGHEVTLFNRGQTNPGLFAGARQITGHRSDPPAALAQQEWDWVFDLSCYEPLDAESLLHRIGERTGRLIFCSTCSVYDDAVTVPVAEDASRWVYSPEVLGQGVTPAYGAKKRAAEDVVMRLSATMGFEATIVRPVLVYGPWDDSDRYHWWLHRTIDGNVILPEPSGVVHGVYVKDLARIFMAAAKAKRAAGRIYNGASTRIIPLVEWVETAAQILGRQPRIKQVSMLDLKAAGVTSLPGHMGERGDFAVTTDRLELELGFTSTPFAQTIAETLAHMEREGRPIKEAIPLDLLAQLMG